MSAKSRSTPAARALNKMRSNRPPAAAIGPHCNHQFWKSPAIESRHHARITNGERVQTVRHLKLDQMQDALPKLKPRGRRGRLVLRAS